MSQNKELTTGEIKDMFSEILETVKRNGEEFKAVKNQVNENKNEITEANKEINTLKNEVNRLKNIARSKNIVIFGLEDSKNINDNLKSEINKILEYVHVSMEQVDFYNRIGKKEGNRPVILSLTSREIKSKFFDNFEVLRSKGLSIANDMTKEERENYKKLKAIKIELFNYGIQNKIAKGKIIINNNEYEIEEALKFLGEIKKEETSNSEQNETK